jgi:hypothetical protein
VGRVKFCGAVALPAVLIHRSAWKLNSANFAFWGFYEVRRDNLPKAPMLSLG